MLTLKDALDQFVIHNFRIGTLWAVFVAATFAAAGFNGVAAPDFGFLERVFLSIGYLAFAGGHWILLRQTILTSQTIAREIADTLGKSEDRSYEDTIRAIISKQSAVPYSLASHLVIDLCVLGIIWWKPVAAIAGSPL